MRYGVFSICGIDENVVVTQNVQRFVLEYAKKCLAIQIDTTIFLTESITRS